LALFAGVRRGELRGLQGDDVDFDAGLARVRRGWDDLECEIDPKTFRSKPSQFVGPGGHYIKRDRTTSRIMDV
jgi:integrase